MNKKGFRGSKKTVVRALLTAMLLFGGLASAQQGVTVSGDVYGGGREASVGRGTTVLINQGGATINGDVYGGGALAKVDTAISELTPANTRPSFDASKDSTLVTILQGMIKGNVYGGGLGNSTVAAHVYGPVHVSIGKMMKSVLDPSIDSIAGNASFGANSMVFGCNNLNGSPKDNVLVDIWQTAHSEADTCPSGASLMKLATPYDKLDSADIKVNDASQQYALKAVYGGGNLASYVPMDDKSTTVNIHTCYNSIEDVYGGGNAADVGCKSLVNPLQDSITANTYLKIDGGRIKRVFGGGNGESTPSFTNPGANICGTATTAIHGGILNALFGGSNSKGDITTVALTLDNDGTCSDEFVVSLFGGANESDIRSDVTLTIGCGAGNFEEVYGGSNKADIIDGDVTLNILGGVIGSVYGGSKGTSTLAANINGNVTLNLFGGTITNAFGGSNVNGNITGIITVNVEDTCQGCPLNLTNVYGAGNLTAYTPDMVENKTPVSPIVNIKHIRQGTSITGNVYGGGYGITAVVTANPKVTIGDDDAGHYATVGVLSGYDVLGGSVYGGGYAAPVVGNTSVEIKNPHSSAFKLFGGGANAGVTGNTSVTLTKGLVRDGLFGGSDTTGTITGNTTIVLNGDSVGTSERPANYNICGGGWGQPTRVNGNIYITQNSAKVYSTIYGGSYYGNVNDQKSDSTIVNIRGGYIDGDVYGGGFGDKGENAYARIEGAVAVNISGGEVGSRVFGCNNDYGAPQSTVKVTMTGGKVRDLFGGGNMADYDSIPVVTISGGEVTNLVIGGGNAANVSGTNITINGGNIATGTENGRGVYGGCNADKNVNGNVVVNITGGTIGAEGNKSPILFGGGYGKSTRVNGNVDVVINESSTITTNTIINGEVYGGSALGNVNGNSPTHSFHTKVNLTAGTVKGNIYGGGLGHNDPSEHAAAAVNGDVIVQIDGGIVTDSIFGCNNIYGAPHSNVDVILNSGAKANYVFGGGNVAGCNIAPTVTISGGTVYYGVFGGGNAAGVGGAHVVIESGTIGPNINNRGLSNKGVYGGCNTSGVVDGDIVVDIKGGTFGTQTDINNKQFFNIFGGGYGTATSTTGNVTVNYGVDNGVESDYPKTYGDLYGGSALGSVNSNSSNTTTVNVLNGSFGYTQEVYNAADNIILQHGGSIYGGGLGEKGSATKGQVNGVVHVNVGKNTNPNPDVSGNPDYFTGVADLRSCSVYGCNNAGGSPQADVYLDVYKTRHTKVLENNTVKYNDSISGDNFAISSIYGGGNEAHYAPENGNANSAKRTHVFVHGCENSIESIYGGGNAADAVGVIVEVEGGHFGDVFGGGNGLVTPANIGIGGQGFALLAGRVTYQYQGCNMQGTISGEKYKPTRPSNYYWTCSGGLVVETKFFGGNEAEIYNGLENTITCDEAGSYNYKYVYAGSRHASIYGDVKLTVEGGHIDNLFGGSKGYNIKPAHIRKYPTQAQLDADSIQYSKDPVNNKLKYSQGLRNYLYGLNGETPHRNLIAETEQTALGGNIILTVKGGTIGDIYGGCDINGNVEGTITINVESNNSTECPLSIDNIYGGSNLAKYEPVDSAITSPVINLKHGIIGRDDLYAKTPNEVHGCVFGGGMGSNRFINDGVVTCNPKVLMNPGNGQDVWVKGNIYGGGYLASVGKFTRVDTAYQSSHPEAKLNAIRSCAPKTGHATVEIRGGKVGPATLTMPDFRGHVFGGGKGVVNNIAETPYINFVNTTEIIIDDSAFVKGSVYGGSENGHVWDSTLVKIQGGQIGAGNGLDEPYSNWDVESLTECNSWTYTSPYAPYDKFANATGELEKYSTGDTTLGGRLVASDGHTFYGNVFGGGSGYFPYAPGQWLQSAGVVYGNTRVEITGGHILTSVYGGNELTDVNGTTTVIMEGGTLGVPRTETQITNHPVTCYLFGGGKGDQRSRFAGWTNVDSAYVEVKGGRIYGSVFGGAEDGHVKRNVKVVIGQDAGKTTTIGTRGTSYVDGNIFGGGRGFSGEDVTEGLVAGNIDVEITGGTMLGSIYGGGRLASVGLNAANGQMQSGKEHGHITVNISGGTIGNGNVANTDHSGNVFGSSMGRLTKLDDTKNPHWPGLAHAKQTKVNISGGTIQKNVYGGGEIGFVRDSAIVNINGGQVNGIVYGGGYGSNDVTPHDHDSVTSERPNTMLTAAFLAGRVYGHTLVNVTNGRVTGDIYGGGEMASVGDSRKIASGNTTVNIGRNNGGSYEGSATIGGNVYGANNIAGSPFGNTRVNIYGTARTTKQEATCSDNDCEYAIANVFGGGHQADYRPENGKASSAKRAYVHVYGCDNTIGSLFGGGDAAAVYGAKDTIDGGRFHFIFGGGNGKDAVADIGAGGTGLVVQAGIIDSLFGGSNLQGSINGPVSTVLNHKSSCNTERIGVFFAGSNEANIKQNLVTNIDCGVETITEIYGGCHKADITGDVTLNIMGGTFTRVFAGSKGKLGDTPADSANISGRVTLNLHGGIIDTAFGGSNVNGNITGQIIVNVEDTSSNCQLQLVQVYGGGKDAAYTPSDATLASPQVNIKHIRRDGGISGDVNGGGLGSTAIVTANPFVTIGDNVDGHTAVVTGDVYGGGEEAAVTGTTKVEMHKGTVGYIFGGGDKANVSGATTVNIMGGTVQNDVYGGGALSETGGTNVTLNGVVADNTKVLGDIYGGGRGKQAEGGNPAVGANVNGKVWVTVTSGSARNVYGCNNFFGFPTDTVTVRVNGTDATVSNVYGGGNLADARCENTNNATRSIVNFSLGNVQNVFGGGHAAHVGYSIVNVSGGNVSEGVYGGCESSGDVKFDATVNLTGGRIGATGSLANRADGVFGGGLGEATNVVGNVEVNLNGSTVYGDLYGGSALGKVNTYGSSRSFVNILSGTILGDVYGGGFGRLADLGNSITAAEADVNGKVYVTVGTIDALGDYIGGASISSYDDTGAALISAYRSGTPKGGSIYGCNNINGTPKDSVIVTIYGVQSPNGADVSDTNADYTKEKFALDQVFGGGNKSSYSPKANQAIVTHIYGCDNTIRRVFGGSNASHATRVRLIIDGGRYGDVYAGGNGEVQQADVTDYLFVGRHGGKFGGFTNQGNNLSNVPTGTNYVSDLDGDSCGTTNIYDMFCGNNDGPSYNDIVRTITCGENVKVRNLYGGCNKGHQHGDIDVTVEGGEIDNVFGGCKGTTETPANVYGDINLTIKGGTIKNVYGGCDVNGNVTGTITVNVLDNEDGTCVLNLTNVYGGGRNAHYQPQTAGLYPKVNINHIKSGKSITGNVYGGGYGEDAFVVSNPVVSIGDTTDGHADRTAKIDGIVFGGGERAEVRGNATVNVKKANTTVTNIFGGGNHANVTGNVDVVIGNSAAGPTVNGDVYGGGGFAHTGTIGNTSTDYHNTVTLNNGTVHGNVYGGGLGDDNNEAKVFGPVYVKVYGGTADSVFGCNNVKGAPQSTVAVDVYGCDTLGTVFGGGNLAAASLAPKVMVHNCTPKIGVVYGGGNAAAVSATDVTIYGGTIDSVFGGGNGRVKEAPVDGTSTVKIHGGTVKNVFGGNNTSGIIADTIGVTIDALAETGHSLCTMAVGNVYGGGNLAIYAPSAESAKGKDKFSPKVTIKSGTIEGTVYGGGKGIESSLTAGLVKSNTLVDMQGGTVKHSIYGGGELASVGDIDFGVSTIAAVANTGLTKVLISGGVVGDINNARMPSTTDPEGDEFGYVFAGGKGVVDSVTCGNANKLALVDSTYLEISDSALITASVYGGCENGMTLGNTHVKISGGQIGTGHYTTKEGNTVTHHWDAAYSEEQWTAAKNAVVNGTMGSYISSNPFHECDHFPFGVIPTGGDKPEYNVYDIYAGEEDYNPEGASKVASNGHSFYGNVFGGGSGYYPFWDATNKKSVWRRTAGRVNGNTLVEITGGHILTGVYGGNEYTDVLGRCTVKMSGGTLGVPRSLESIEAHPVTCYLFGAGMGDPRTGFNTWTTVDSVYVEVSGGIIYGSVFGGGEDGHVKRNVNVVVKDNAIIGTWGTSYVDGNVFGGGRGFKSDALTAGVVAGNVTVDIQGGTMLGSIYGGGRLASVGTHLVDVNDGNYGKMQENEEHGFITVNVSGGTIGNNYEFVYVDPNTEINNTWRANNHLPHTEFDDNKRVSHTKGGNVFGGPMGRLEKIASTEKNPLWSRLGMAKQTKVNISGSAMVKGSVYGGSELGTLTDNAEVTVSGGTIGTPIKNGNDILFYYGSVYGGGYGSDRLDIENVVDSAGRVFGNTTVYLTDNGEVRNNIYGGGDLASVTGSATVSVTGGKVGPIDALHRSGNVYGAGKGKDDEAYKLYSNVASTHVTVSGGEIAGDVYGGGADAHVIGNTSVNITTGSHIGTDGLSGYDGNIFGGGRGSGKQTTPGDRTTFKVNPTCGRVGGNTSVTMDGGVIQGSIFGGGRLALVGVDVDGTLAKHIVSSYYDSVNHGMATINISGGHIGNPDGDALLASDFSIGDIFGSGKGDGIDSTDVLAGRVMNTQITLDGKARIYGSVFGGGEMAGIGWWNETGVNKGLFYDRTGSATVTVNNCDTIGTKREFETDYITNPDSWTITNHAGRLVHSCTGNVIGGSQGDAATTPYEGTTDKYKRHWVSMGRSRTATVTIGGGNILGEVFGGAEQGTVRGNTRVNINGGIIGTLIGTGSDAYYFGSVYGGGYGSNDVSEPHNDSSMRAVQIAGRVYGNTSVSVNGGTVKGSVYGGGSYASVGDLTFNDNSLATNYTAGTGIATVSVTGGTIGVTGVGNGNVYGSSRGDAVVPESQLDDQAWVDSSSVTVSGTNTRVLGNVFGGGENGHVLGGTVVDVSGGTIGCTADEYESLVASLHAADYAERGNVYGGGAGVEKHTNGAYNLMSGIVMGNTKVTINKGAYISRNVYGGGDMASVGTFTVDTIYTDTNTSFALSWPVSINYTAGGDTRVEIFGGHIGTVTASSTAGGDVYGSSRGKVGAGGTFSKLANVNNTIDSIRFTPSADNVIVGDVYGSGENGHVYGDTRVVLVNGTVGGSVYGGGKGTDTYSALTWIQTPSGWIKDHVDVHSLTAGKVFGNTHVVVGGGQVMKNVYGGGNMASVGKGNYNGFGEHSSNANDTANTGRCYVDIYGGQIGTGDVAEDNGHVFGAGQGFAFVPVEALPEGGHLYDYCRDFFMSYVNKTYVTIGDTNSTSSPTVTGSVFGGSENGHVRYNTYVQVNKGVIGIECTPADTVHMTTAIVELWSNHGNVYGAGRGRGTYTDADGEHYNRTSGSVTGSTRVDINGGTVHRNVYGGGSLASVGQNIGFPVENSCCVVNMNSNTGGQYYKTLDYGGYTIGGSRGLASPNATDGNGKSVFIYEDYAVCANTQVNIMEGANALKQSCYGGGEFGRVSGKAQVNVIGGDINTIYCGGKGAWGEAAGCENDSVAGQVDTTELNLLRGTVKYVYGGCRRALVSGDAIVNVGKDNGDGTYSGDITVTGAVYGCNRYKGSPKGDVYVNVYKTAHTATDSAIFAGTTPTTPTYAIPKVFGGGAEANYDPEDGKQIHLTVYSCDNTIQDVYGGGDAASVTNTTTIIRGGRFDRVFGGGNGTSSPAHVTGTSNLTITAGQIHQLFGGSNRQGSVRNSVVTISHDDNTGCPEDIDEYFGGGNQADIVADSLVTTIECGAKFRSVYGGSNKADITGDVVLNIKGGHIDNVFGGSKGETDPGESASQGLRDTAAANIDGNVTLNIYGGTIKRAFGGSNINGNITKKITVNVDWKESPCDQQLDTVFGGSNLAAYTPTTPGDYPEVNIKNVNTSTIKDVFGGGLGQTAVVTSNPKVTIGDLTVGTNQAIVTNVFGGGDLADVEGTATVLVQKGNSRVTYVYGGGNADTVGGTQVFVTGGTIDTLFGGGRGDNTSGKKAKVKGNDTISITGGRILKAFAGSNLNGDITGRMHLRVDKSGSDSLFIGEVYGGGNHAAGHAGTITIGCTGKLVTPTTGKRHGYELEGISVVYGGANEADVTSDIHLTVASGVVDSIFGGNNKTGDIAGKIYVTIDSTAAATDVCGRYIGYVFGGGNRAPYGDTTEVNIKGGIVTHHVFGGGNKADVKGSYVKMEGGTVKEDVYGGCNTSGTVTTTAAVTITNGTVKGSVYGGGLGIDTRVGESTTKPGKTVIDISGNASIGSDVYGGGNEGKVYGETEVKIH